MNYEKTHKSKGENKMNSEKQQEARQEAEAKIKELSDEDLEQIAGGKEGDARPDVNEAMADDVALEQDIDGFDN